MFAYFIKHGRIETRIFNGESVKISENIIKLK